MAGAMTPRARTVMEVGRRAGVSATTVARVIYSNGYVGEETRTRVEAALKSTGYRPNIMARGLRTQRSFTIGHVFSEMMHNPFFVHVARCLEREAVRVGYKMFILNHNESIEEERLGVERFLQRRGRPGGFHTPPPRARAPPPPPAHTPPPPRQPPHAPRTPLRPPPHPP